MTTAVLSPAELPETPYVGLSPFGERDAYFFSGRDRERRLLASTLLSSRVAVLYGASGVGKSSLVLAGLGGEFRLRARTAMKAGRMPESVLAVARRWSDDPVATVAAAVERAVHEQLGEITPDVPTDGLTLEELLLAWTRAIDAHGDALAADDEFVPRTELLVVLDQFEEYFLYHPRDEGPATLAGELPDAVANDELRANFLISIREDAYTQLDRFEGAIRNLFASNFALEHLDEAAARRAIRDPIERYNELLPPGAAPYDVEDELVEAVIAQVPAGSIALGEAGAGVVGSNGSGDVRIATPFLQLVLTRLWQEEQRAGSTVLRAATLERLGGAERLVRSHLEEAMNTLDGRSKRLAASVFRQLVTPSGTKIAHSVSDLAEYAGTPPARLEPVLDGLATRRILRPVDPPPGKTVRRFEIFHDVLAPGILGWRAAYAQRAARRRWLTGAGALALLTLVFGGLAFWALHERSVVKTQEGKLVAAHGTLAQMQGRLTRTKTAVAAAQRGAEVATRKAARASATAARATATAARTQRAAADAQAAAADARSAERVARDATAVSQRRAAQASAFAQQQTALARTKTALAARQTTRASRAQARAVSADRAARAQRLAALSIAQLGVDPAGALRSAVAAVQLEPTAQAESALRQAVAAPFPRTVLTGHTDGVEHAAFSPDGRRVVTASWDKTARIWDAATGKLIATLNSPAAVRDAAFSPDGSRVVTGGAYDDWAARVWAVPGTTRTLAASPLLTLTGDSAAIRSVAYNRDGTLIVTASDDSTVRIWDAQTGREVGAPMWHPQPVRSAAFSPDGTLVVTGGVDGVVRLWNAATQTLVRELKGHTAPVNSVAFSPDGTRVVSSGEDSTARIWRVADGQPLQVYTGHNRTVDTAQFDPTGEQVLTASSDGTARIWDVDSGATVAVLRGHANALNAAAYSPDGRSIVTASWDLTARIWAAPIVHGAAVLPGHAKAIDHLAYSRDGAWLATASLDGTARVWDAQTRKPAGPALPHPSAVLDAAFSPDGSLLVTACGDTKARVWDWRKGTLVATLPGTTSVESVAFSPDGKLLATGELKVKDADEEGLVWNWPARTRRWTLHGHTGGVSSIAFSPNGKLLVSAGLDARPWVWEARTGKQVERLSGHTAGTTSASFSPDSALIVTASNDATARIWSVASGKTVAVLTGHREIATDAVFSPNGKLVATASQDGTVRLWDVWSGAVLAVLPGQTPQVRAVAFAPDGSTVALGGNAVSGAAVARLYECSPSICGARSTLLAIARRELAK